MGSKTNLTCNVARNSYLSQNLPLLWPFEMTVFRNPSNLLGVNRAKASSRVRWTSPKLCCLKFVLGLRIQAHISHQCPWAATKSMAPAVSKPSTAKRRRATSPSQLPRRLHQFPIAGEEGGWRAPCCSPSFNHGGWCYYVFKSFSFANK